MYPTNNQYKTKIYDASTRHILKIYINHIEIDKKYILECKFSQELFSKDEFCLGSVTAKAVELKLYKTVVPNKIEDIYIESGTEEEIIPMGHFKVEEIKKEDDYTVTLNLLDNMIKFEFNYDGSKLNYPCSIENVLKDICKKAEVELRFYFFLK